MGMEILHISVPNSWHPQCSISTVTMLAHGGRTCQNMVQWGPNYFLFLFRTVKFYTYQITVCGGGVAFKPAQELPVGHYFIGLTSFRIWKPNKQSCPVKDLLLLTLTLDLLAICMAWHISFCLCMDSRIYLNLHHRAHSRILSSFGSCQGLHVLQMGPQLILGSPVYTSSTIYSN